MTIEYRPGDFVRYRSNITGEIVEGTIVDVDAADRVLVRGRHLHFSIHRDAILQHIPKTDVVVEDASND